MTLTDLLQAENIVVRLRARDRWGALDEIVDHLEAKRVLTAAQAGQARDRLLERERALSTAFEHGVAVPHAALDGLTEAIACMAIAPEGVDFAAPDGEVVRVVLCLLSPKSRRMLHTRTLADAAVLLSRAELRAEFCRARNVDDVLAALRRAESACA